MNPDALAAIHARAFSGARGWSAAEIAGLLDAPGGFVVTAAEGFALGRAVAGEAELLTIAVAPEHRRKGQGRALLAGFEAEAAARGADAAFLEVAADNAAARALYTVSGWRETGRRKSYYPRPGGAVDAITLTKALGT
ncbi:GNAT family N-acetyltransferase [Maritimibacter sp. HL-12]|uniref:GNAT family N-acetyltransferase n=1 Tax=Maritimibacter sp. HL-12 TaxID=1162418 RepID=UPI000A0F2745|nr:GNAT family N-acetyltransferase [Maritimibacter sp. HL-12]SMH49097.1 ribosomal-protein-alanine N-acetyltransferase [Maritimibacter sp. HL-12]